MPALATAASARRRRRVRCVAAHVAQGAHQRQLGLSGFREARGGQAADLQVGHLQADGDVIGAGRQHPGQCAQLLIAVAGD